jgi:hypothetical protein
LGVPLPGGACDVGGDDVGRMPVQAAAGPLWRTQVSQLSECPPGRRSPAMQPLLFLDALEESPLNTSTLQRTDPASEGRTLETCLVRRPPSGGAERYSDPVVTC